MIPIVTPEEMAAVDAAAPEPIEVLIERAGACVAWAARRMLGGVYGHRVVVVAGKGNNGADGRVAAERLARWGARVRVIDAAAAPPDLPAADLVIDAAFGTGLARPYAPPRTDAPVLAVDIASGVDGLTGAVPGSALPAVHTVTFQALKPGLLFEPGASYSGTVEVADLGLDVSATRTHLLTADDVHRWLPPRSAAAHKWHHATWVVAGAPGMSGAGELASRAAARAGAGFVRWSCPGVEVSGAMEVVTHHLPASGWADDVLAADRVDRFASMVIGPGLGRGPDVSSQVWEALAGTACPTVVDADGIWALADHGSMPRGGLVLTPHDGEFEKLTGRRPGGDRIEAARTAAAELDVVVLLKGPATVVAAPEGDVLISASGDQRLATAGSGDVLSGIVGALLARGMAPFEAAATGAWIHGRAAELAPRHGMVAPDLLAVIPEVLGETHMG